MIQVQDRPRHKNPCNNIKAGREKANELEAKLRADGAFDPTKAGHWTMLPVNLYLKARFQHGELLFRSWRQQGIEDALPVFMGLIRYDRADREGCRQVISSLLLRLGRD